MLDKRAKRQIEWAFKNYAANKALGDEQVAEIAESGLTVNWDNIACGGGIGNPTEQKALRLMERAKQYLWAKVVENTKVAFRFEAVYDTLVDVYEKKKKHLEVMLAREIPESTYFYRLDKALDFAYMWAFEYKLV